MGDCRFHRTLNPIRHLGQNSKFNGPQWCDNYHYDSMSIVKWFSKGRPPFHIHFWIHALSLERIIFQHDVYRVSIFQKFKDAGLDCFDWHYIVKRKEMQGIDFTKCWKSSHSCDIINKFFATVLIKISAKMIVNLEAKNDSTLLHETTSDMF